MSAAPEIIRVGDLEIRFHRAPAETDGVVAVFESVIPAGARVPVAHSHVGYDEWVFGLAGACHFYLDDTEVVLTPGASLFVPRGRVHRFVNRGPETARVLVIVTPGLLGPDYFREVAGIVNAGGPPDLARIGALMQRHGMMPAAAAHAA